MKLAVGVWDRLELGEGTISLPESLSLFRTILPTFLHTLPEFWDFPKIWGAQNPLLSPQLPHMSMKLALQNDLHYLTNNTVTYINFTMQIFNTSANFELKLVSILGESHQTCNQSPRC